MNKINRMKKENILLILFILLIYFLGIIICVLFYIGDG